MPTASTSGSRMRVAITNINGWRSGECGMSSCHERNRAPAAPRDEGSFRQEADAGEGIVAFHRGDGFASLTNASGRDYPLPDGVVLLASQSLTGRALPTDATVWLQK